jgi:signal transduction histidine kinase
MATRLEGPVRLGDFILQNLEAIISTWEEFARAHWPSGEAPDRAELRDNAENMLRAVAADMAGGQAPGEWKLRAEGEGKWNPSLDGAALTHAKERLSAGFDIVKVVGEFRALRASVMHIWQASNPAPYPGRSDDLMRFNESIDELVAISVEAHSARVEQGRRLFLGIIGHDLRQPLCSVRLLVSALARGAPGGDLPVVLGKIQNGVDAMEALVRDLLDLSGSQLGKPMAMYPVAVDLGELAAQVIGQVEAAHPGHEFALTTEGDLSGEWDGFRLRQMLSNLLGNAAQHGRMESVIELAVREAGESVVLTVMNSGRPIPKELLSLLFDPLVRHSLDEADGPPGSMGLGLYICREVVRAHQGTIEVTSSEDGTTTFTIVLPRGGKCVNVMGEREAAV